MLCATAIPMDMMVLQKTMKKPMNGVIDPQQAEIQARLRYWLSYSF